MAAGESGSRGQGSRPDEGTDSRDQPRHSIGLVAERTGLSTHVLRAWENRYGAVEPARTAGGHRAYSDRQLHRLRLLARLTDRGHRIGRIATLATEELERMARSEPAAGGARAAGVGPGGGEVAARGFLEEALQAVESYEGERLEDVLRRAALLLSAAALVEQVAAPLLEELGDRWSAGDLSPGQEHLASAVLGRVLAWVMDGFSPEPGAPTLVATTPAGQAHRLGALLAATTAAAAGWRVVHLGEDLPAGEIVRAVRRVGARAVALSLVHPAGEAGTARELRELAAGLPDGVALLVGGRAASSYGSVMEEVGGRRLPDFAALRSELARLAGEGADAGEAAG